MRTFRNFLNEVSLLNEQPPPGGGLPGMPPLGPGGPPGGGLGAPAGLPPGGPPLGGPPGGGLPPPMPGGGGPPPMGGPPMGGPPSGGAPGAGGIMKLPELDVWKILSKLLNHQETKKQ